MPKQLYNNRPINRFLYILLAYLIAISFFSLFRIANAVVYCSAQSPDLEGLFGHALLVGVWFDTLVACFVLAWPLLHIIISELAHIKSKAYYAVVHYFIVIAFTVCFFACAADIPYFNYFFTRLNAQAVNWGDNAGVVLDMIVSEPTYIVYFFAFLIVAIGYWILMHWVYRRLLKQGEMRWLPTGYAILLSVVLIAACFIGMRGRLSMKSPMRVGTAYFCNNAFLNKIGLNPVFTFFKSIEEQGKEKNQPIALIDETEAETFATNSLSYPIPGPHDTITLPEGTNVVLVIMESMCADNVGFMTPQSDLTPNLDSLMAQSLVFTQAYSAGIHTHNGVFSTLFSYPAIMSQNILKRATIPQMCGLPQALVSNGYFTQFFITHDSEFDNMNGFLLSNDINRLVSQADYAANQIVGTWGVPDHVMFDRAIEEMSNLDNNQPFLTCILTCSNHGPFIYPENIDLVPKHDEMKLKMVEYSDWAIGRFMWQAAQQPWFNNTLFVFIADHGAIVGNSSYDMPLSYHHEPLFFYYPGQIAPQSIDRMALQIDLAPTLLGMLPIAWNNQTLGIDLMRWERPYAYFSADDKIGVVDGEWFYIYRASERQESIFRYRENDTRNQIASQQQRAKEMQRYAFSMIQLTQSRLRDSKTHCN